MRLERFSRLTETVIKSALALLTVFSWTVLSCGSAIAQLPSKQQPAESPIQPRNLAKDTYSQRQRATLEMWRGRKLSRQAVQDAARNQDPEVAERAAWILKQWRSGAVPGANNQPSQLLFDRGSTSALETVLEQGAFDAVLVAVEESAGTIEFDQIKRRVARSLTERYPIYADKAFDAGTETDLLKLLDAVAVDRSLATATRDLMRYLEIPIDDSNRLPSAASMWSKSDQSICLSQFAMSRGDHDESIRLAEESGDKVLLRIARMLSGRWDDIANQAFADTNVADTDTTEAWAWGLAAASRTNDAKRVELAIDALTKAVPATTPDLALAQAIRWRALAMHGKVDLAIDSLAQHDRAAAANIATASSRYRRAEELCGFDLKNIALELDDWIDAAYEAQAELPARSLAPSMARIYSLARLLVSVGDTDNAFRIYRRLTPRQVIVTRDGLSLRDQTLRELDLVNRTDWIAKLAVSDGESTASATTRHFVAHALGTNSEALKAVLDRSKVIAPLSNFRQRFDLVVQLFRGQPPATFDPDRDFRKLFLALVHSTQVQRTRGRVVQVERIMLDQEIINMFTRNGQVEFARQGLEALARSGDIDAMIALANTESELGNRSAADALWNEVGLVSSEFSASNAMVTIDHGLAFAKSVAGKWVLAKRAGQYDQADELLQRLRLILTSPSLTLRKGLADHLRDIHQHELAVETFRDLIILASFGGDNSPDFFRVAVGYVGAIDDLNESDPESLDRLKLDTSDSVKWSDLAALGILNSMRYHDRAFVSVPTSVSKAFLEHAIEHKDKTAVEQAIRQVESFDPLNIDFGERMLPDVRKAGMPDLADAALDRLIDKGLQHISYFGTDATALNNVAWTAAMNNRRLDEALELSKRAVMLEPDSVVYRDTLAEVLHLLGRNEEAYQIESACLLDEPEDWHVHEQVAKYGKILGKD